MEAPLSEKFLDQSRFFRTCPTGEEHWQSDTERSIFSQIAFIDYGYFYDKDNHWYYIMPGHPMFSKKPYRNPNTFSYAKSFVIRELKELVQAYDGYRDDDTLDSAWPAPEWFIREFRNVMNDDRETSRLLDENLGRLLEESKDFESALERGLEEGEKQYRSMIGSRNLEPVD